MSWRVRRIEALTVKTRGTVLKTLKILEGFADHPEATCAEVAVRFGMPRPTAYGLLETLVSAGYLHRDGRRDVYRQTNRSLILTRRFDLTSLTAAVAAPRMREMTRDHLWPVEFLVRSGVHMLVMETSDRHSPVSIARLKRRGTIPVDVCAAGYAYLAFCPEAERRAVIAELALAAGAMPETFDAGYIESYLPLIRRIGFSRINFRPSREKSIAAPVFAGGQLVGALQLRYIHGSPVHWQDIGALLAREAGGIGEQVLSILEPAPETGEADADREIRRAGGPR
jgi:IclR family mhp operon transcriptional activator